MTRATTVRMRVLERVPDQETTDSNFRLCIRDGKLALDPRFSRVPTRDAILSAEDPNDVPARNAISGICDPGKIWDGVFSALESLPSAVRDEVGKLFMSYAEGQGWKVDASGAAITTGDSSGRRLTNFAQRQRASTDAILEMNAKNATFWANDSAQSRAAAASTDNAPLRTGDMRTAAGMRTTVAGINEANARHWDAVEASRARR